MEDIDGQYWMSRTYELWKILDDIDTAGDIAKSNDVLYRGLAEKYQSNRWNFLEQDEVDLLYEMFYDPATDILPVLE